MKAAEFQALPHSEESERAVLAAVLLSPSIFEQVAENLEIGDFYLDKHQAIYGAMAELTEEGFSIDLRTLQARLELKRAFELVGGLLYLTGLDMFLPDISRILEYVAVVKECSARRRLLKMAADVTSACLGSGLAAPEIVIQAERALGSISLGGQDEWVSAKEAFEESDIVRREQADGTRPKVYTGITELDNLAGALEAGEMVVIGGNPKMGKTSLARQLLLAAAKQGGIFLATLEETVDQVMPKMACAAAGVSYGDWRNDNLDHEDEESYWKARKWLERPGVVRLLGLGNPKKRNARHYSWTEVQRIFRKAHRKSPITMSCIDFIQLLCRTENVNWELENLTAEYAMLCGQLKMIGVAVSQLTLDNAKKPFKKNGERATWRDHVPSIANLRGSGGIGQAASKVIFPIRPGYFERDNPQFKPIRGFEPAKMFLPANRNGPTGEVDVLWRGSNMTFSDAPERRFVA